jgi:chloramphenicol-sensitive protein RarD
LSPADLPDFMPSPRTLPAAQDHPDSRRGLAYGIAAYGLWGLIPLYFKAIVHVGPYEVLAQRVFWSCVLLTTIIVLVGRIADLVHVFRQPHVMRSLAVSTTLIGVNWLIYIYAVSSNQVLEASLGYFMTPLVNVLLGCLVLHERLRPLQQLGIAVATCGVVVMMALGGGVPWIALVVAASFALYGLARKTLAVDGLLALAVETLLLLPLAIVYIAYDHLLGGKAVGRFGFETDLLLAASGPITAVPLLCFGAAARRLKLTTLGFLQYLAPTVQLLLAILIFGEPFALAQWASFGCAWLAVAIYTTDSLLLVRRRRSQAAFAAAELPVAPTMEPGIEPAIEPT